MAFYSTFFLSEPDKLQRGFPGWKLPLPEPVTRKSFNPFTREEITITTRAPEWEDFDPRNMEMPEYQVVAIDGDYETYLEQRIPPFVQSQPHWCAKNLTSVELEPLVACASGVEKTTLQTPLYAHPSLGSGMNQFPEEFVTQLKTADNACLHSLASLWAARMSTPEHTHSVSGTRISDDWTIEDALSLLNPIAALVKRQSDGQALYLLMEA